MATGPEHYRMAEDLIADVTNDDGSVSFGDGGEAYVAVAQVHALLALAAATALIDETPRSDSFATYRSWQDAAGQNGDRS